MGSTVGRGSMALVVRTLRRGPMTLAIFLELIACEPGEDHKSAACLFWQAHREGLLAIDHRGMVVFGSVHAI